MVLCDIPDNIEQARNIVQGTVTQIKVTYKTAWYINKRIRKAMTESESKYKLEGNVTIDEAYFSGRKEGESAGGKPKKRGRCTNKFKVIMSVSHNKNKKPMFAKMRVVDNFKAKTIEKFAHDSIVTGATITTDGFRAYKSQSLKKNYFHKFDKFDKTDNSSPLKWLHIFISNAKAFINGTFHVLLPFNIQHLVFDKLIGSALISKPVNYYSVVIG
jgi:hypothetical protein